MYMLRKSADASAWHSKNMAANATPATTLLVTQSVTHQVHTYNHDPRAESYGTEAVDALSPRLGVDAGQIFKTLVITLGGSKLAVAVLPVPDRLSLKAAAAALGASKAAMAERADVERVTGYVFGGVSPLGQRKQLPTVIDDSVHQWDRVLCSGGRRGMEIELTPDDLIRLTHAVTAPIGLSS